MKRFIIPFCAFLTATVASVALAAVFTKFSPATGILKGAATTYVTTAAASSDITATFSGTCNSTTFLRGDGACASAGGATTGSGTFTLTGCTASESQNYSYSLSGSVVTLLLSATAGCTSNATSFNAASGAMPAEIRPSAQQNYVIPYATNNSVATGACVRLQTNGGFDYFPESATGACDGTTWTAAGNKQINTATSLTYRLN